MKRFQNRRQPRPVHGFTLIELLVVVTIIGLLAAVALPKFGSMLERSKEGATKANMSAIRSAVTVYYTDQANIAPLTLDNTTYTYNGAFYPAFIPTFLEALPAVKVTGYHPANGSDRNRGPGYGGAGRVITYAGPTDFPFASTSLGQGWRYDRSSLGLWVNSSMVDLQGLSYSLYGYE